MFDRCLVLVPLLGLATTALVAQDTTVTTLRHRADSPAVEWRRADLLARVATVRVSADRRARHHRRRSAAHHRKSPAVARAEAAARAWAVVDSMYGSAAQHLPTGLFHPGSRPGYGASAGIARGLRVA
jgi:hypothetical protein